MKLHSRRQLRVEGLETRMLLAADVAPISEANVATANDESSPVVISDGIRDQSGLVELSQKGNSLGAHEQRCKHSPAYPRFGFRSR